MLLAAASTVWPTWLVWPLGLLFILSLTGLCYSIRALIRVNNPTANAFELPATLTTFRFTVSLAGEYEVACIRPSQWGTYFKSPGVALQVRRLATGTVQHLPVNSWHSLKRTDMSGTTTLTMTTFSLAAPGEYELLNPEAARFQPGDRLRLLPAAGSRSVLLVLSIVLTGMISSFILRLLAACLRG